MVNRMFKYPFHQHRSLRLLLCVLGLLVSYLPFSFATPVADMGQNLSRCNYPTNVGAESPYANPAYLAFYDSLRFGIQFLGIGISLHNNTFSLKDYSQYNGAYLNENDKRKILKLMPTAGWMVNGQTAIHPVRFRYGPVAFSVSTIAAAEGTIAEDLFSLLLFGNQEGYAYRFRPAKMEALFFSRYSFSFAKSFRLDKPYSRRLAVGLNANYLHGHFYGQSQKMHARALTEITFIRGDGHAYFRYAEGGRGFSFDLGLSDEISANWQAYLNIENIGAQVRWTKQPKRIHANFILEDTNIDEIFQSENDWEEVIVHSDSSYRIAPFTSRIPLRLTLGGYYHKGKFAACAEYGLGMRQSAITSTRGRLAVNGEYSPWPLLPLRLGLALGGKPGCLFSYGFGIRSRNFNYDVALQQIGSVLPTRIRGLGFVSGFSLDF